jgi:hypothetical protein
MKIPHKVTQQSDYHNPFLPICRALTDELVNCFASALPAFWKFLLHAIIFGVSLEKHHRRNIILSVFIGAAQETMEDFILVS